MQFIVLYFLILGNPNVFILSIVFWTLLPYIDLGKANYQIMVKSD